MNINMSSNLILLYPLRIRIYSLSFSFFRSVFLQHSCVSPCEPSNYIICIILIYVSKLHRTTFFLCIFNSGDLKEPLTWFYAVRTQLQCQNQVIQMHKQLPLGLVVTKQRSGDVGFLVHKIRCLMMMAAITSKIASSKDLWTSYLEMRDRFLR